MQHKENTGTNSLLGTKPPTVKPTAPLNIYPKVNLAKEIPNIVRVSTQNADVTLGFSSSSNKVNQEYFTASGKRVINNLYYSQQLKNLFLWGGSKELRCCEAVPRTTRGESSFLRTEEAFPAAAIKGTERILS